MQRTLALTIGAAAIGAAIGAAAIGAAPAPVTPAPTIAAAPHTLPADLGARPRARESTLALARFAIAAQDITPPTDFIAGLAWSAPYAHDSWRGRVWICDPREMGRAWAELDVPDDLSPNDYDALRAAAVDPATAAEVCFALVDDIHGDAVTGP